MQPLIEGAVDTLMAWYQEYLPAALSVRESPDVPLPAPVEWRIAPLPFNASNNYPAFFVLGRDTDLSPSDGLHVPWSRTQIDADFQMTIAVALQGTDPEVLRRQAYRYMEAAWFVTMQHHYETSGNPDHVIILGGDITMSFDDNDQLREETPGDLVKRASLAFLANTRTRYD